MLPNDGAGAADLAERGEPQLGGADGALTVPEPLEYELEIRRLHSLRGRSLVQHGVDEHLLRSEPLAAQLAVAVEGAEDGRPAGLAIEPVEAQEVPEHLGDP